LQRFKIIEVDKTDRQKHGELNRMRNIAREELILLRYNGAALWAAKGQAETSGTLACAAIDPQQGSL